MHRPVERPVRDLTVEVIRDHYDQFAWANRIFFGEHVHRGLFASRDDRPKQAQVALLRSCAHQVEVRPGSRVIDAGCGYGGAARFLAQEYACTVLALAISATQPAIAHKLRASTMVADASTSNWRMRKHARFQRRGSILFGTWSLLKTSRTLVEIALIRSWTGDIASL